MQTLLKPDTVARRLAVSRRTVYRLVHDGKLVALKIGAALRITETSLERFIRKQAETFSLESGNFRDQE